MKKLLLILLLIVPHYLSAQTLLREDFNDLENWKPLLFPKIKEHSKYEIVKEGDQSYLKAESNASASGLIYKKEFNVFENPNIKWRWKVENVFEKGDATKKTGDDYPLRIYVVFKYDPDKAGFGTRLKYKAAKLVYGEYPPAASLNYIWANKKRPKTVITSPYVDQAKMIPVDSGKDELGVWKEHRINILEDFQKAFGEAPPAIASVAIMSDADNTKEKASGFVDFIEIFR